MFIDSLKILDWVNDKFEILKVPNNLEFYLVLFEENDIIKVIVYSQDCQTKKKNLKLVLFITNDRYIFLVNENKKSL